jgi:hypothetical protein
MSARKKKTNPKLLVFDGFQTLFKPSASLFRPVETSKVSIAAAFLDQTKQSLNNSIKKSHKVNSGARQNENIKSKHSRRICNLKQQRFNLDSQINR